MNETNRTIPLEQATPGMILAEAVRYHGGNTLLPRATILNENHLASLRQRGIKEISIISQHAGEESSVIDSATRLAMQEIIKHQVQHLFRRSGTDAATQALLRTVLEYRRGKIE